MPQAVLTVVPRQETDMLSSAYLAGVLKDEGRIYDWRIAGSPRGILKTDTDSAERLEIASEFKATGYTDIAGISVVSAAITNCFEQNARVLRFGRPVSPRQ